ncbi:MAG: hypothetical protein E7434_03220 [Ruminococcaceae bacterium]|nr:hypothetical protein [Oscillospiraceae bacterium]
MKKLSLSIIVLMLPHIFSGCTVGSKMSSMSVIYAVTTICSLLLLIGYCCMIHKKESWFVCLFTSVFVVNMGYLQLSLAETLNGALMANRIAYLGSVFLPISMLMIIMKVCDIHRRKWVTVISLIVAAFVFLIAASPGYLDIYYKSVTLQMINGVAVLNKEYGPWHSLYLVYLSSCFGAMIATIAYAMVKKKIDSLLHALILAAATFVNIVVWLLEQLVKIDFEILSVSYIISEVFLLGIYAILQEQKNTPVAQAQPSPQEEKQDTQIFSEQCEFFKTQLSSLTPTEHVIYTLYLDGKGTKDVMQELSITENTLKFHNKNIYSKLGVKSRKQLLQIAAAVKE